MNLEELKQKIQQKLDILEKKSIFLTRYGNITGWGSIAKLKVEDYKLMELEEKFDLEAVQRGISLIPILYEKRKTFNFNHSSYGLKHHFEKSPGSQYISNGDFIMAMLICGFKAQFSYENKKRVNCFFDIKTIRE